MIESDFLDSNVVLYAYDSSSKHKREVARRLLAKALLGECTVSVQVFMEVATTLLHKASPRFPPDAVVEILDLLDQSRRCTRMPTP